MKYHGHTDEFFEIVDINASYDEPITEPIEGQLSVIWFMEDDNQIKIDSQPYTFNKNQIVCLTSFHKLDVQKVGKTKVLRFNSPFYCLINHDSEVGCKGILFFGSKSIPVLIPEGEDIKTICSITQMVELEMQSKDGFQQEMLQMLLKRLLIMCTRIYKTQTKLDTIPSSDSDLIREFNFLVEQHFKEKHSVAEYAKMLNKSPKTLSNLFGKIHDKTPLKLIQERLMLESRRLLRYTDTPISEIGYAIGFQDIQSFSRFFKKNQGQAPSEYRTVLI